MILPALTEATSPAAHADTIAASPRRFSMASH